MLVNTSERKHLNFFHACIHSFIGNTKKPGQAAVGHDQRLFFQHDTLHSAFKMLKFCNNYGWSIDTDNAHLSGAQGDSNSFKVYSLCHVYVVSIE